MAFTLIFTDLKHQVNSLLIARSKGKGILVSNEAAIVSQLADCVQHCIRKLLIIVEATLNELSRRLQRNVAAAMTNHFIEKLEAIFSGKFLESESSIDQVVQVVLC
jgi:hypothetical protein